MLSYTLPGPPLPEMPFYYLFSRKGHVWEPQVGSKCLPIFVLNVFVGGNKVKGKIILSLVTPFTRVGVFWRFWAKWDLVGREVH